MKSELTGDTFPKYYTLEDYYLDTRRTLPSLLNRKEDIMHMASGICTEILEYSNAPLTDLVNRNEELGDIMWYISNMFFILGISGPTNKEVEDLYYCQITSSDFPFLFQESIMILDMAKKYLAYGKEPNVTLLVTLLHKCIFAIRKKFVSVGAFNHVLYKNIEKLKVRYPEKFDEDKAINRNIDKERNALS